MQATTVKTIFIAAFLICVGILGTCQFSKSTPKPESTLQDTIFLNQWRHEKTEKLHQIARYEKKLQQEELSNDSLRFSLAIHKQLLTATRNKAKDLQDKLKFSVNQADTVPIDPDIIRPLVDSLLTIEAQNDTACDLTICDLEKQLANRDSTILVHVELENTLRDLQKDEELRTQILTEQLNTLLAGFSKKTRQAKRLKAALLVLTGISASLLLTHSLK